MASDTNVPGTYSRSPVTIYGLTLVIVAVAAVVRWLLDSVLVDLHPFVTFYVAVIVAAWLGGLRPALLAMGLGFVLVLYLFVPPRHSFAIEGLDSRIGSALYFVVCFAIAGFSELTRRAQRRVVAKREILRVTLASIGDAVIATDTEGRISFFNAVAESVTGWTPQQAIGQPLDVVFRIINEHSRKTVECPATRALREGLIVGLANHTVLITRDGTERPIDDSAAPIRGSDGKIIGCVLVFRDITQRRSAEHQIAEDKARIQSIVGNVVDGIISIDEDGTVESFNFAAERLFGYTANEVIGNNVNMLMPEPYHQAHDGYVADYLRTGQAKIIGIGREVEGRRKDGSTFPMALAVSDFSLDNRRYFTGIVRDISDQKEAEKKVYELLADLQAADMQKDVFLATLAHELRGPLAPLCNTLEILKRADGNSELLQQARGTIERQLSQMVRLVDDLLDVSRITRNKLELRKGSVELASVLQQAAESNQPLAESFQHEVSVTLPSEPIYLHADATRLTQVFSNLLNNACKYTEPGGRVWLSAERQGSDVLVSVKDTGVGIPRDKLNSIFELFTQIDRSLDRMQDGLGIGLSLVKRLVELHDGTVEALSDGPGLGSEFVVRLPRVVELHDTDHPIIATPQATARRVLIVDDNKDSAKSLALLLKLSGNETYTAYDGLEAVEEAERTRPDLVLLDIGLPKLNGFDACRRIRDQPWGRNTMMIALTGWGQDEDRRKAKEAGFDQLMVKPVEYMSLLKILAELTPTADASGSGRVEDRATEIHIK